jgi:hypothetical protein
MSFYAIYKIFLNMLFVSVLSTESVYSYDAENLLLDKLWRVETLVLKAQHLDYH